MDKSADDISHAAIEKAGSLHVTSLGSDLPASQHPRTRWSINWKAIAVAVVFTFLWKLQYFSESLGYRSDGAKHSTHASGGELDFEDITPSEKLEWHPCRKEFLCARLTVPMDYHRPLNASPDHPKVHIALLMAPGKHGKSKSPLLINPGGPGGSGTIIVQYLGSQLQQIVGEDQDIIGFDPRGIGSTTPPLDCFSFPGTAEGEDDLSRGFYHRLAWQNSALSIGLVNSSADALSKIDARARAKAKLCQDKDALKGNDSIFRYAHTPSVARDMLSIVDAWDQSYDEATRHGSGANCQTKEEIASEGKYSLDTKGKLVYWGFSYGTLLGATFASMFPDRVGRVILDGVVDADHYVAPVWQGSIRDSDTIFNSFPKYCHEGKERCRLYRTGDTQIDIEERVHSILQNLTDNPLILVAENSHFPFIFTINELKGLTFGLLYSPIQGFGLLAQLYSGLWEGNYELLGYLYLTLPREVFCGNSSVASLFPNEAQAAIMCSDKRYVLNESVSNLEKRFEKMANISSFADVWMGLMIGCDAWGIKAVDPPMRWDDHPSHRPNPINTSFPLLFLSNTADPVTPLHAGLKMARKFVDAGLIEQQSMGHCTLAAASRCTLNHIRAYFQQGSVPPPPVLAKGKGNPDEGEWVKCEADDWPFHEYEPVAVNDRGEYSTEVRIDAQNMEAWRKVQKVFDDFDFFGALSKSGAAKLK